MNGGGGGAPGTPLCGAGTEGQRFVPDDPTTPTEYCDNTTGLIWPKTPDATTRDWATAVTYCQGLGGGHRLPFVNELHSLVDYSQADPALPAGHPFMNVGSFRTWSATTVADSPPSAWIVFFFLGTVSAPLKSDTLFVWCVRGGS
ncbi:MAG: DUF1566 domain-containing protein [Nitrospirae bacterium]|nr:DUF1566 domain-containing protein [Nitrospirota bacterium]